jgi:hypothetical protein
MGIKAVRAVPTVVKLRAAKVALLAATRVKQGKPAAAGGIITQVLQDRDVWKAIIRDYQAQAELEKTYG